MPKWSFFHQQKCNKYIPSFCKYFWWKKSTAFGEVLYMHTFLVRDTCLFLRLLVIFYSQMQELRTTFFWLLIASYLALFKRILQTTYLLQIYIHCWLNSVFKIKLALFNFKIAQIKFSFVGPSLSFIPTKTPQSFTLTVVCYSNDAAKA